jgi:DNA-binding transcriptional LysR family regulator
MELRHLRYFVAVAETLHFGQAAAKLSIAQPSLSQQIQQLEAELQAGLLRRTKRRVELTEAGRLFLDQARDILARTDRAAIIARRVGRSDAQRLRVGFGYCMDQSCLASVAAEFGLIHQAIQVEVKTLSVPSQLASLREGRIDIGFVRPPVSDPMLNSDVLIREALVIALPSRHRLATKPRVSLAALEHEPFILVPRDAVPVYHDAVLKACRVAGFMPHGPHEADQLQVMIGMVAAGAGVALVPESARRIRQHRVVYRPVQPAPDPLETAVAWRRDDDSPILAEFLVAARLVLTRRAATAPPVRRRA